MSLGCRHPLVSAEAAFLSRGRGRLQCRIEYLLVGTAGDHDISSTGRRPGAQELDAVRAGDLESTMITVGFQDRAVMAKLRDPR